MIVKYSDGKVNSIVDKEKYTKELEQLSTKEDQDSDMKKEASNSTTNQENTKPFWLNK